MKKQKNLKKVSLKKIRISKLNGLERIIGGMSPLHQDEGGASGTGTASGCPSGNPRCSIQC